VKPRGIQESIDNKVDEPIGNKKEVEVKVLVPPLRDVVTNGPFRATAEIWTKVLSSALDLGSASRISIRETRWKRKFDTTGATPREIELDEHELPKSGQRPVTGWNVELTKWRSPAASRGRPASSRSAICRPSRRSFAQSHLRSRRDPLQTWGLLWSRTTRSRLRARAETGRGGSGVAKFRLAGGRC
jgi:hypothetical protein